MPKFSVKKPFTVLVAVILVVVLGFVSLAGMQTDLLPNMNLPYLLVVTTYPGASPEQVESDVTQPLENSLSTLNGVKNVTSQSNENYSLVILEYQDDTDMDSAMVKASTAVNQLSGSLPDMASTPTLMEMSPDMMATQYVAVDYEGMDIYELSDYVEDTIVPQLERVDGVASVSTTGLVKKSVQITLDQDKIDEVNDKLLVKVSDRLAEAKKQLDENDAKIKNGLAELDTAQSQLDSGKAQLNTQKQSLTQQLRDAIDQLNEEIPKLEEQIAGLKTQLDTAQSKLNQLKVDPSSLPEVTLPIDDALFASCKEILAKYDPQYDANAMPANLEEAKSDLTKMAAMLASIERAQQAIETEAAALTGGQSVSDACAALDAQILTLTVQVQQKDNEIVQLEQQLDTAAPEEQDAIRAEIEAHHLNQRVTMVGFQSGENLWQYVRNCACVVVPSEWYEASGYTACEAQAIGKPVVATNAGGLPENIVDGETGFISPMKDEAALADAIGRVMRLSDEEYQRMAEKSVANAKKLFDASGYVAKLLVLYANLKRRGN